MKHLYAKQRFTVLLILTIIITSLQPVTAQCPAGSVSNTAGTYTNGQVVCISTSFSGTISLNNGAKMVVVSGGNFTGTINTNNGSEIEVKAGGTFNPGNANNLAAAITVDKNGTVRLGSGGISLSNGFGVTSNGSFTWAANWNQNNDITVTNSSCGAMIFTQGTNLQNNATINNNGMLIFQGGLNTNSGTTINNRGRISVAGDFNAAGLFNNEWQAVFSGSNNNFNTGDSVINLYSMVFKNALNGSIKMRNEGLFWIGGSFAYNGGTIQINRTNAQVRVGGALSNNAQIRGIGKVYVAGSLVNNGTMAGKSSSEKLVFNQTVSSGTRSNLQLNTSMTAEDTLTFAGGAGNPDICPVVLPMVISSLKATYNEGAADLTWYTLTESNSKKMMIEYSTDGLSFATAGEVDAKGNSATRTSYSYRFTKITSATLYFRLMLVDKNGNTEYTNMVMVKTGLAQKMTAGVYPNPFAEKLEVTLSLAKTTPVAVKIYDINGRIVKTQVYNGQSGNNKLVMKGLSELNKGIYVLEVSAAEEKWIQKVIR